MPNLAPGVQLPAGQVNILPQTSLVGAINAQRPDRRKVSEHKTSLGFTNNPVSHAEYLAWRQIIKDQMSARNFANLNTFPNAEFVAIVEGMRRLRPACDALVRAHAANNIPQARLIDEAVVQLTRDSGKKFTTTLLHHPPPPPPKGAPQVIPAHIMVDARFLPPGAPGHWDPTMAAPNAANVPAHPAPPIAPPANAPVAAPVIQFQPINAPAGPGNPPAPAANVLVAVPAAPANPPALPANVPVVVQAAHGFPNVPGTPAPVAQGLPANLPVAVPVASANPPAPPANIPVAVPVAPANPPAPPANVPVVVHAAHGFPNVPGTPAPVAQDLPALVAVAVLGVEALPAIIPGTPIPVAQGLVANVVADAPVAAAGPANPVPNRMPTGQLYSEYC
jgi:hypothetical protein